jgi:hypothetical protein
VRSSYGRSQALRCSRHRPLIGQIVYLTFQAQEPAQPPMRQSQRHLKTSNPKDHLTHWHCIYARWSCRKSSSPGGPFANPCTAPSRYLNPAPSQNRKIRNHVGLCQWEPSGILAGSENGQITGFDGGILRLGWIVQESSQPPRNISWAMHATRTRFLMWHLTAAVKMIITSR